MSRASSRLGSLGPSSLAGLAGLARLARLAPLALLVLPAVAACSSSGASSSGAPAPAVDAAPTATPEAGTVEGPDGGSVVDAAPSPFPADAVAPMELRSSAFDDGADLPAVFTCDGNGQSMPFAWSIGPAGTKAYAIVVTDTTLPGSDNIHWILYDVTLAYVLSPIAAGPSGPGSSRQAVSSFAPTVNGYSAPCPEDTAKHSYKITLYAVDEMPLSGVGATTAPKDVVARLEARKLGTASMGAKYLRQW